jgi:hypothetical protein
MRAACSLRPREHALDEIHVRHALRAHSTSVPRIKWRIAVGLNEGLLEAFGLGAATRARRAQADVVRELGWDETRQDALMEVCCDQQLGRARLAAEFGELTPVLELYWTGLCRYTAGRRLFWQWAFVRDLLLHGA